MTKVGWISSGCTSSLNSSSISLPLPMALVTSTPCCLHSSPSSRSSSASTSFPVFSSRLPTMVIRWNAGPKSMWLPWKVQVGVPLVAVATWRNIPSMKSIIQW